MSDYFSKMKSGRKDRKDKLKAKILKEKENQGGSGDSNVWKLERGKDDNGWAIIRFLPPSEADLIASGADDIDDVEPYVLVWRHWFTVNGQSLIENCPRVLGQDCPVCDTEKELVHAAGGWDLPRTHPARIQYTQRKGKKNYWSNIYVVKDPVNPENEGKVMLYNYGPSLHEMITSPMFPEFPDDPEMDPFCPWEGANFRIKIYKDKAKDQYSYAKSSFDAPSPLAETDEAIFAILKQSHPLHKFLEPSQFKTAAKLQERYERVVNGVKAKPKYGSAGARDAEGDIPFGDDEVKKPSRNQRLAAAMKKNAEQAGAEDDTPSPDAEVKQPAQEEDGDDMAFFKGLLEDD